jgi:predicted amidohydrolase
MTADTIDLFTGLACIQFRIELGEPEKNLGRIAGVLASTGDLTDTLVVLPEMWSSGFAYGRFDAMAEATGTMLAELAVLARRHRCILAGSMPEKGCGGMSGPFFNTLYVTGADGVLGSYRKQQIFAYGGEGEDFAPGFEPYPVATPLGLLGCLVCYDLRFPGLARTQCQQGADLLICPAQWPLARIGHWRTLLRARAIENQTFVVACNGSGIVDGMELGGCSAIIDPHGNILDEAGSGTSPQLIRVRPDWQQREEYRSRFRSFAVAAYPFRDERKIVPTVSACLELLRRRKDLGQKLVCCEVSGQVGAEGLQALEDARRCGDFLLVVLPPVAVCEIDCRFYAALGCVDAVCRLAGWSEADLAELRELTGTVRVVRRHKETD